MINTLVLATALQLTPAMPSTGTVFDDPRITNEVSIRCGQTNSADTCALAVRSEIARLRDAYASDTATPEQRVKMLSLIDAQRSGNSVDWTWIVSTYFAWRANATGETAALAAQALQSSPRDRTGSSTIDTRCYSGRYSSRCITTTR